MNFVEIYRFLYPRYKRIKLKFQLSTSTKNHKMSAPYQICRKILQYPCKANLIDSAAARGHNDVIEYIYTHGDHLLGGPRVGSPEAINLAAKNGHLHTVSFLNDHQHFSCTKFAMNLAASEGHLEIVKWFHYNRKDGCTFRAMDFAAANGHFPVVRWLAENRDEGCSKEGVYNSMETYPWISKYLVEQYFERIRVK
jgi:hypothetical protein